MYRILTAALSIMTMLSACGANAPRSTPRPAKRTDAYVVRSGFSVRDGRVGVAALVRVRGNRTVRGIKVGVSLFAGGRRVGRQQDTLPYCPSSTDCWWGQGFYDEHSVDRVRVEIIDTTSRTDAQAHVEKLPVVVQNDEVVVTPRGEEGTAYLVALYGREPSYAISFFTRSDETAPLRYGNDLFPITKRDRLLAVFYPGAVPAGAYGPTD